MAGEKINTADKSMIPRDKNFSSEESREDLVKLLEELTPEEIDTAAKELEEREKKKRKKKDQEQQQTKQNKKVYGEYPGNLPKEFVDICNGNDKSINFELNIYFSYKDAEEAVNKNFLLERHGHFTVDADTKRNRIYAKHFLMAQTRKFGVEIEKEGDGSIKRNESFLKRQKYRDDFFASLDKDKEKAEAFIRASKKHESLIQFLPKTRWNGERRGEEK